MEKHEKESMYDCPSVQRRKTGTNDVVKEGGTRAFDYNGARYSIAGTFE
jgi:hypothetical protein